MDSLGFQSGFYDNDPRRSLLLSGSAVAEVGGQLMGSPNAAADAHAMMLMKQKQAALKQEQAMMSMSMPMPMMANSANLDMEMMMMKEQQAMQQQQQRALMMGMPSRAAACNMEMEMMMRRNARAQQIEQMELQQRQQQQIQMQYERQMMKQGRQQRQQEQQMLLQQSQKVNVEQQANMLRQLELMNRMDKGGGDGGSNNSKSSNFKQPPDEIPSSLKSVSGAGVVGTGRGGGIFGGGGAGGCFPVKPLSGGNGVTATRNSFSALVNRGAALAAPGDINFSIGVTSSAKLTDMQMDRILKDGTNKLVSVNDRDLISDALLISIAQLEPCTFRDRDRVGCYKTRPMGFVGLSCKHCGGQPGFGRFFPNSVRSLAQTTTSQTIIKHIATNCPSVPVPIREVVQDCQRQELEIAVHNDNLNAGNGGSSKRVTRYGSRKIFFQGLWSRLHDDIGKTLVDEKKTDEEENQGGKDNRPEDDTSNKTPELHDSSTTAAESLNGLREEEEEEALSKEDDGDSENRKDASLENKKKKRERSQQHCDKEKDVDGTPCTNKRPRVDA